MMRKTSSMKFGRLHSLVQEKSITIVTHVEVAECEMRFCVS
jgi:hypothetical protein